MGRSVEYIETVIREPIATRPLFMQQRNLGSDPSNHFFTHDGNKNVSDVVSYQRARGVVAHYDYAPFGAVTSASGPLSSTNPFRFSSEYHDDTIGLVYYNYRNYNPCEGVFLQVVSCFSISIGRLSSILKTTFFNIEDDFFQY